MKRHFLAILGRFAHLTRRMSDRSVATYQQNLIARYTNAPSLAGPGYVTGLSNLAIGRNVHIGRDFFLRADGGLAIGDNTHISHRLTVYTLNHNYEGALLPYDDTYLERPVTIGRNVWIGFGVTILPGANIGDGAIVGAGAVVAGPISPGTIFGAATGGPIKTRSPEHYRELDAAQAYSGHGGAPLPATATQSVKRNTLRVLTLSETELDGEIIKLARRVRDHDFIPDVVVGIKTGGEHVAKVVMQEFPNARLAIVQRQRLGTQVKSKLNAGAILQHLPYRLSDRLRILEHRWRERRALQSRNSLARRTVDDCSPPLGECKSGENRVLIIDDAVDSGDTMADVVEHVREKFPNADIRTLAINSTMKNPVITPDYVLNGYGTLIRFFWSKDYHAAR